MGYHQLQSRYDFEINDSFQLNPELCHISSPIPIINHASPYNHHKEQQFEEYINNISNPDRIPSYTQFLTDNVMDYGNMMTHASTPESSDYSLFMEDSKVKMEYESLDVYMSRTLSSDSCPDLAGCQTSSPLTPIDSPHDQSPILSHPCLPMSHHHNQYHSPPQQQQQLVSEDRDIIQNQMMMETPSTTTTKRRGRKSNVTTLISGMQIQQDPQDFQLMGSASLPPSPQKTTGKSRGRRMTNKPAKPGTKSFECTYAGCGRVFKRSEHLKRHIRSIHTLERPFHCPHPHCSKRFSRSDNLSQHIRVHRPNGKEKNTTARTFSNFTPFLQTYQQTGGLQSLH